MSENRFFPRLFEPIHIGKVKIKNRIVQGPTERHSPGPFGEVTSKTIDYYVERAKGGFGLIVVGAGDVGLGGRSAHFLNLGHSRFILEHCELTEAVHAHGAKIAIQLTAVGRNVPFGAYSEGQPVIGPSPIPAMMVGEIPYPTPRALDKGEIYRIMDTFAQAAYRVRAGGYDLVQLHGAHGFLITSFMSPLMNKRTDEFGGTLENRMRFPLGIVRRIREVAGGDFPIDFRFSADEFVKGGVTVEESPIMAKMLEDAGVSSLNVSAGIYESYWKCNDVMRNPEGWKAYIWEAVKKAVSIPVIAQGVLRSPDLCEKILSDGKADLVSLSRGAIADPEWPRKAAQGRTEDIRRCLSCNECHPGMGGLYRRDRWPCRCAINAEMGREGEFSTLKPASTKKRVMVVGSGPAGLEAARIASLRGHDVTIYEKGKELGGPLQIAAAPPGKEKILWFRDYLITQLRKQGVKVELGTEVTADLVRRNNPDAVIVATGAVPIIPEGIGERQDGGVVTALEVLSGDAQITGKKVVVAGGGMIGCETAEFLAGRENSVTIIEMLPAIAADMELLHKKVLVDSLKEEKVVFLTERRLIHVTDKVIVVENCKTRERETIEADVLVLALGMQSRSTLATALEDQVSELYVIGDCVEPRRFMEAVYEGSLSGRQV
jgi:2,4-dienoyl-CoA reductase-like NADH-dependent reductase (Old Yellow Enzyme family)/NADPH-dependent 2,4-dienoyl-CoA reductase/sulfur reductase-like enzyme